MRKDQNLVSPMPGTLQVHDKTNLTGHRTFLKADMTAPTQISRKIQ